VTVQFGLGTLSGQVPSSSGRSVGEAYRDVVRLARHAEDVGFDSVWISEHHGAADGHIPSPIVVLAAVAAVTTRIRLGSGIAIAPFQHLIRFAEDCAVVDQLSGGRLLVGVGPGWREEEFRAFGVDRAERIARTIELISFCRAAWRTGRATIRQPGEADREVRVEPTACGPLPILLGGEVPASAARAGRLADGFIAPPMESPHRLAVLIGAFDAAARDAGRDPVTMPICFQVNLWVARDGRTPPRVRRAMWHKMGTSLRWHADRDVASDADLPPIDEAVVTRRSVTGTPDAVAARLEPFLSGYAGRDLHVLARIQHSGLSYEEVAPAIELFAETVMPALRTAGRAPTRIAG
jgi:alkanesulfonate monooxygenase SsuD/methylene tetrahydromethanopterin reductase-like flavin-dependent oxidoreductase (luciferase family)